MRSLERRPFRKPPRPGGRGPEEDRTPRQEEAIERFADRILAAGDARRRRRGALKGRIRGSRRPSTPRSVEVRRPPAAAPSRGGAPRSSERPVVTLVVDGSALDDPGPGGWAALLRHGNHERLISGMAEGNTTNNRMELVALLEGLKALRKPCDLRVVTDSQYMRGMVAFGWKRRANADLLEGIDALRRGHAVTFELVRGHAGHPDNERVDREARSQAERAARGVARKT